MTSRGWPVFDPGAHSLADLYEYEVEIDQPVDIEVDFQTDDDRTEVMPPAWLIERCTTAARAK